MPATDDAPVRLLHLSDVHFRADTAWDADPVLCALARAVADDVRAGLVPDLVVITGDLAHAGKPEEYRVNPGRTPDEPPASVGDWLEGDLWPALSPPEAAPLPRDRLLLVPGNHDVDLARVSRGARSTQAELLHEGSQDSIAEVLADAGDRDLLLRRHAAYLAFYGDWLGAPQPLPWWQRSLEIRGQRLHVAGLDSAWVAMGGRQDYGRLLLGQYQVHQTLALREAEGAHWRLALVHHPWDHLAPFDGATARETLHLHRDLILRGHRHGTEAVRVVPPDPRRVCLELAAGCVYHGSAHPNAFQWIELYPRCEGRPRRVRVLLRAWVDRAWQVDRNQPGCPDGAFSVDLDAPQPDDSGKTPPPSSADLTKYLADLWKDTEDLRIRGVVTGSGSVHRFPIEELYVELQASGGPADAGGRGGRDAMAEARGSAELRLALTEPRLVIVGDPGCGKTTFLRWVAHCLAADRLGRDPGGGERRLGLAPGPGGPRLPILVPIADWLGFIAEARAQHNGPTLPKGAAWLDAYLGARAKDATQGLDATAFLRWLRAGEALILLDGLDEAPDRRERQVAVTLIEALARAYPDCPIAVTSRPAAYQDDSVLAGFAHTRIEALDPAAIDHFLKLWSAALFRDAPGQAERHHRELAAALASRPEIRRLARNTVMLTALAVVHWNDKRLPEQRAELYEAIVNWLVLAREDPKPERMKPQRCRQLLGELALAMQRDPRGRQVQVSPRWAAEQIARRFVTAGGDHEDPECVDRAEAFLAEEEIDSGLLVRRGHQLRFWHLTFQEYLAAHALAGLSDAGRNAVLLGADPLLYRPEWRESVLLLAGVLYLQGADKVDGLVSAVLDALADSPSRAEQARAAGLLGGLVRDLSPFAYRPADPRYGQILDAALAVFDPLHAPGIPLPDRIAAADALALAGDPRLGWTTPGRWVELPGGRFLMGAQKKDPGAPGYDPQAYQDDREAPVHRVRLSPFAIAAFPVTVAEYGEFLEDEDHRDPRWWAAGGGDKAPEPDGWEDQQAHPSRPVVGVSWYRAMAYCAWLTHRLGQPQGRKGEVWLPAGRVVRLPTEAEWEYAVRGESGRRYPWGNAPPDPQRANYSETKLNALSPVGIFPGDRTPEGVMDLAGNVLEWCLDAWVEGFYAKCQRQGETTNPLATGSWGAPRVLRGGSFDVWAEDLRASDRGWDEPGFRVWDVGFRCVLAPPRQP